MEKMDEQTTAARAVAPPEAKKPSRRRGGEGTGRPGDERPYGGDGQALTYDAYPLSAKEQLRAILLTLRAMRQGDFKARAPEDQEGIIGEIGAVLNDVIGLNQDLSEELLRVSKIVG